MKYKTPKRKKRIPQDDRIIEESRSIAQNIVRTSTLSINEQKVAERVIIANGDPSLLDLLIFRGNPVERGIECVNDAKLIITDIEMVRVGINKKTLKKSQVLCFLNDAKAKEITRKEGITRSAAGIRLAKNHIHGNIVVIGNSPTACLELFEIVKSGVIPNLIVATPVGFINAAESKEKILSTDVPCIAIKGTRGGTPSAVAIINEIIELSGK